MATKEELMAQLDEIQVSQTQTNTALTNISGDVSTQKGQISTLQATIEDLKKQLEEMGVIDPAIAAKISELQTNAAAIATTTQSIADSVPGPNEETPA